MTKEILYDYHVHSCFSFDCETPVDDICRQAMVNGLTGLMFTDHTEFDNFDGCDQTLEFNKYAAAIAAAQEKYPRLILGCGTELGLQPQVYQRAQEELDRYPWDFVIGSVHIIRGRLVFSGEFANNRSREETYRSYLECVCHAVKHGPHFDVLGHLDLIRRDYTYHDRSLKWANFPDELDIILRTLIERGSGIEINTAASRYGLSSHHPDKSVLERYRQLGGEIITCGADSHQTGHLGKELKTAYQTLKDCGFRYISTFSRRELNQLPLNNF